MTCERTSQGHSHYKCISISNCNKESARALFGLT